MSVSYSDISVRVYDTFALFPASLPISSPFALDKSTGDLYYWDGAGFEKIVNASSLLQVSKTLTYNLDGTLNVVTDVRGTKTMGYNLDGTLASLTGTGVYQSKTFTYVGGQLTGVTVV